MDVNERLRKMLDERGLTTYKMAELSGLSHTTLANVFKRNTVPSINTLQAICKGFGITLSQFFAEGDMVEMTILRRGRYGRNDTGVKGAVRRLGKSQSRTKSCRSTNDQRYEQQQMNDVCRPVGRRFLYIIISPIIILLFTDFSF